MDLDQFRAPVEVFEAAAGNPEPLARRLESGAVIYDYERAAIAMLVRGELKPLSRRKGQHVVPAVTDVWVREKRRVLDLAANEYRRHMAELKKSGTTHQMSEKIAETVAKSYMVPVSTCYEESKEFRPIDHETLINYIRTSKKNVKNFDNNYIGKMHYILMYSRWLHQKNSSDNCETT